MMADVRRTPEEVVRDGAARARATREGVQAAAERLRAEQAAQSAQGESGSGTTPPATGP